jgi:hypothetical protein
MTKKKKDEDFVELNNTDEIASYFDKDPRQKKEKRSEDDTFSLETFLELDGNRLDKANLLFSDKLNGFQNFNQTQALLVSQENRNEILENELVQRLMPKTSILNIELAKIWKGKKS